MDKIPSNFFINNRQNLINSLDNPGLIIVPSNGLLQSRADTTYPFKQDSNFFYLTGINEPNATLVINTINGEQWLQLPTKSESNIIFDGETNFKKLKDESGIQQIIDDKEGWQKIKKSWIASKVAFASLPPKSYIKQLGFYANPHRLTIINKLKRFQKIDLIDIRKNLCKLRQIKQPIELQQIRRAVDITKLTLNQILPRALDYKTEAALEGEIFAGFRRAGAKGHAYDPVIASGINAFTVHYMENNDKLNRGELLLVDVGAEVNNYAADISRTVALGGKYSKRQQAIIKSVESVHASALEYLKPGVGWRDYIDYCDKKMAVQLMKLGLITSLSDKTGIRRYFPHSISHYLGLDVHDVGDYSGKLQENMVITVEPGIYIPEESIGVRLEDDIVITKIGAKIL